MAPQAGPDRADRYRIFAITCPYHRDEFWQQLKTDSPTEWDDAVAFDHAIRHGSARTNANGHPLRGTFWLHSSRRPLDQAPLRPAGDGRATGQGLRPVDLPRRGGDPQGGGVTYAHYRPPPRIGSLCTGYCGLDLAHFGVTAPAPRPARRNDPIVQLHVQCDQNRTVSRSASTRPPWSACGLATPIMDTLRVQVTQPATRVATPQTYRSTI